MYMCLPVGFLFHMPTHRLNSSETKTMKKQEWEDLPVTQSHFLEYDCELEVL